MENGVAAEVVFDVENDGDAVIIIDRYGIGDAWQGVGQVDGVVRGAVKY